MTAADEHPAGSPLERGNNTFLLLVLMLLLCFLAFVAVIFLRHGPGGDGVIASLTLEGEGGLELRLEQSWNDFVEPYSVRLLTRVGGATWKDHYIDHEDTRWRRARLVHDPERGTVDVYRGETLRGRYDLTSGDFVRSP